MTYAHGQTGQARRSRLLGSIFARTPRDTSASSEPRAEIAHQRPDDSTHSKLNAQQSRPAGWRDVTARLARETLAERICVSFFERAENRMSETPEIEGGLTTAGQRLEALGNAEAEFCGQENVASLPAHSARCADSRKAEKSESVGASLQSLHEAKAA